MLTAPDVPALRSAAPNGHSLARSSGRQALRPAIAATMPWARRAQTVCNPAWRPTVTGFPTEYAARPGSGSDGYQVADREVVEGDLGGRARQFHAAEALRPPV